MTLLDNPSPVVFVIAIYHILLYLYRKDELCLRRLHTMEESQENEFDAGWGCKLSQTRQRAQEEGGKE